MQWLAAIRAESLINAGALLRIQRDRLRVFELLELLGHLLEQGFSLHTALMYLAHVRTDTRSRLLLDAVTAEITAGEPLSDALGHLLPPIYMAAVRAGEASGNLVHALQLCTEHRQQSVAKREQLLRTLSYPGLLLAALVALVCTIALVMVPAYRAMCDALGFVLPAQSALIFQSLQRTPVLLLGVCAGASVAALGLLLLRRFAPAFWQELAPRLPLFRGIWRLVWHFRTERLCQLLSLFVDSGMPIANAFEILAAEGPVWLRSRMQRAHDHLLQGDPLSQVLGDEWNPLLRMSFQLSEGTGDIRWLLKRAAVQLADELEHGFNRRLKRLEPLLLLLVGGILSFVMLAVFVPMYNLAASISTGSTQSGGMHNAESAPQ